jgi:hypothetical protein
LTLLPAFRVGDQEFLRSKGYFTVEIEVVRDKIRARKYIVSFTHTEKLRLRRIEVQEIEEALLKGVIIETYPEDPRGPSCLIMGFSSRKRPLHVLCGNLDENKMLIITAYEPDPEEWEADWQTRKEGFYDV